MLREQLSPEQIVGRLKHIGKKAMSYETIYRWIQKNKAEGGELWKHLRCSRKLKRKRYGRYDSRGRLAGKKMITERPPIVEERSRTGDWEIDTVHGCDKASLVTIVDRKSGVVRIGKIDRATALLTQKQTIRLLSKEKERLKTITADNGSEFHCYKKIEEHLGVPVFFATPHHAWERGTNENTNGLIRQYFPKGTSLASITQQDCNRIADKLNNRPRKRHGYRTPNEVYYQETPVALQI